MTMKFRLYSDMQMIAYPSFKGGRKKGDKLTKKDFKKAGLVVTDYDRKFMSEQEICTEEIIEHLTDQEYIKAQPVDTIGQVYNAANGYGLSTEARKKISRIIGAWSLCELADKKVVTWTTFTVPDKLAGTYDKKTDDLIVQRAFKEFLKKMRRYGLHSYLWVAERQDGKRNDYAKRSDKIHFHSILVWSEKTDIRKINLFWLYELNKAGFKIFQPSDMVETKLMKGWTKNKKINGVSVPVRVPPIKENITLIKEYAKDCGFPLLVMPKQFEGFHKLMIQEFTKKVASQSWKESFLHLPKNIDLTVNHNRLLDMFVLNPVDIEILQDLKRVMIYVNKYINQQEKDSVVYCRPWACSTVFQSMLTSCNLDYEDYISLSRNPDFIYKTKEYKKRINEKEAVFTLHKLRPAALQHVVFDEFVQSIYLNFESDQAKYLKALEAKLKPLKAEKPRYLKENMSHDEIIRRCLFEPLESLKIAIGFFEVSESYIWQTEQPDLIPALEYLHGCKMLKPEFQEFLNLLKSAPYV